MVSERDPPDLVASVAPLVVNDVPAHEHNYSRLHRARTDFIVIHATHGAEGPRAAEDGAAEFQHPLKPPRSCHYFVDSNSVARSIAPQLTAWHCGHTGNARGIGVEICGRSDQSRAQWYDAQSLPTLQLAARLVASLCFDFDVPSMLLDAPGLRLGLRGITTHAAVALAWGETDHTDPGHGFPLEEFRTAVALHLRRPSDHA
jgi:N-acetyl-anhydromuramyl-L-alanine amidase AmpD